MLMTTAHLLAFVSAEEQWSARVKYEFNGSSSSYQGQHVGFSLPRHLSKTWHLKATNFMLDALNSGSRQGGQWLNSMQVG